MWGQRGLGAQHLPTNIAGKYKDTGQKKLSNLSPLHSLQNHESDKQWITSVSLPINTCIVFLPLNLIIVDVIVLVTNTLNLF